jgi:heat shock protein HtpX
MDRNTVKTFIFLAGLGGLMVLIGSFFGRTWAIVGLGLGLVMVMGSYWFSDKVAVAAARAKPVTEQQAPQLYAIVRDLTVRAHMPMPRLYVTPDLQPNAFATGRNPSHAVVACTTGILQMLDADELRGVLAHELSHVRNRDILIGSVAASVAMGITFIARMLMWGAMFGDNEENNNPLGMIGLLAMMILAPLAAGLMQMALSRSREFEADHSGAKLLGTGEPLARALAKIESAARQIPMKVDPAHATAYIINPFTGRQVSFASWFSTHPPTAERIARLQAGK